MRRSIQTILLAVTCAGLSTAASGCKQTEGAYAAERSISYEVPMNSVGFLTERLGKATSVESTGSSRNATNMLEAWVQLRNRGDDRHAVSVRTNFYDENKRQLESTPWALVFLDPRGTASYSVASIYPAAAYYYVEVREANS